MSDDRGIERVPVGAGERLRRRAEEIALKALGSRQAVLVEEPDDGAGAPDDAWSDRTDLR